MNERIAALLAVSITFLSMGPWSAQPSYGQSVPIPQLALWQTQMLTYGQQHCANLAKVKDGPIDSALGATYYDLTRVMHQIATYTRAMRAGCRVRTTPPTRIGIAT